MNRKGGVIIGIVAWIALIVGGVALILALVTYRKSPGQDLSGDVNRTYDEYYQKTRLQIGRMEIKNNLDSAKRDIEDGDFNSALTQIEEAEADLEQLAEDLDTRIPQNTVFSQLKDQIRSQNREASLATIRQIEEVIDQIVKNSENAPRR